MAKAAWNNRRPPTTDPRRVPATATSAPSPRAGDNDAYGHVNNVVYAWFDTAVNRYLIEAGALDIHAGATIGLVVGDPLQLLRLAGLPSAGGGRAARGASGGSVRYEVGLFAPTPGRPPPATSSTSTSTAPRAGRWSCPRRCGPPPATLSVCAHDRPAAIHAVDAAITSRRDPRLPAPAGAEGDHRRTPPARRHACAVGHEHAALEGARAHRRGQRALSAAILGGLRRPGQRAAPPRNTTVLPDQWRSPTSTGAARSAGTVRPAGHRQDRQGLHARPARAATTPSSTRRSA